MLINEKKIRNDVVKQELHDKVFEDYSINDEKVNLDFDYLDNLNSDIIGWILIPGTAIDYPIVKYIDNEYYLNHDVEKKENIFGAIFMDKNNDPNFLDLNTVIFGHTVQYSNAMFSDLRKFINPSFFQEHNKLFIYTSSRNYELSIIDFYKTSIDDLDENIHKHFKPSTHLVTLITCAIENGENLNTDMRYVLHAVIENF